MSRGITFSLVAWVALGILWFFVTRSFHPTLKLALIVTTSLTLAFAAAVYMNHLFLIPRYWATGRFAAYAWRLLATILLLTAATLAINRTSYFLELGSDPDPFGLYRHYAIDFLGMIIHVSGAAMIVWILRRMGLLAGEHAAAKTRH